MQAQMKRHIYRPGDQVEILRPRWIKRVGYPLHWKDLIDNLQELPGYTQAVQALGFDPQGHVPFYLCQAIAKVHVERNNFGGNERTIHYCPLHDGGDRLNILLDPWLMPKHGYVGRVVEVYSKRMAYTGTRFPSRSGKDADTPNGPGDYWEESGGLDNRKGHLILRTGYGEIEACDVRLVNAAPREPRP